MLAGKGGPGLWRDGGRPVDADQGRERTLEGCLRMSWSVVDDSERAQWTLTPFERVGPLQFGMSLEAVATAMEAEGFVGKKVQMSRSGALVGRTCFHPKGEPSHVHAVTAYTRQSGALAAVAVDALQGPQVTIDGMRLIGQVPSQLEDRFFEYTKAHGLEFRISVGGEPMSEELGLMVRAQRARDILLTRVFFTGNFDDWAFTVHDSVPGPEWDTR
ncbi:hypothetical protein [Streptomyces sp. NPDC096324]|uniref:hypothetical protein n=1 Tax=Streptomyces sp. NPDC096324 TaxID=3366085 RepID=UPI0037F92C59